jgi:23S rRNA (guanosine2251-2'-O)-methyltransferase
MSRANRKARRPTVRRAAESSSIWLSGIHPVREALLARRRPLYCLCVRSGSPRTEHAELVELARAAGVTVELVSPAQLEERLESDANDQGVALQAGPLPELSLDELIEFAGSATGSGSRLVALDGVEDPQNLGALARVAESAGAHGLILTERRAPALTPAVSRASAGAIEWLRVARVPNLSRALAVLQASEYWVVAAAPAAKASLFETEDRILTGNLVVVLGAEGKGIRQSIIEQADHLVEIPMRGEIASLNVSAAGAIILYDLLRRAESGSPMSSDSV